jgi:hypothetical protein
MLPRLEFDRVRVVAAIRHPLPQQGQHPRVEALLYLVQSVGGLVPLTVNTRRWPLHMLRCTEISQLSDEMGQSRAFEVDRHVFCADRRHNAFAARRRDLQQFDWAPSIFRPLLDRELNKHQPARSRHARVGGYHLLIVHVTGDVGRSGQESRGDRLPHLGKR